MAPAGAVQVAVLEASAAAAVPEVGQAAWRCRSCCCLLSPTGRKREWFKIEDAIRVLQYHKPVQASYFETLRQGCLANNGTPVVSSSYSGSSVADIR